MHLWLFMAAKQIPAMIFLMLAPVNAVKPQHTLCTECKLLKKKKKNYNSNLTSPANLWTLKFIKISLTWHREGRGYSAHFFLKACLQHTPFVGCIHTLLTIICLQTHHTSSSKLGTAMTYTTHCFLGPSDLFNDSAVADFTCLRNMSINLLDSSTRLASFTIRIIPTEGSETDGQNFFANRI